jgi:hypothetical protein
LWLSVYCLPSLFDEIDLLLREKQMHKTLFILLLLCFVLFERMQCKICTDSENFAVQSMPAVDGESETVFSVDRQTSITMAKEFESERCKCGDLDVAETLATLQQEIQTLRADVSTLRSQLQTQSNSSSTNTLPSLEFVTVV